MSQEYVKKHNFHLSVFLKVELSFGNGKVTIPFYAKMNNV